MILSLTGHKISGEQSIFLHDSQMLRMELFNVIIKEVFNERV